MYYLSKQKHCDIKLAPESIQVAGVGFAVRKGSDLGPEISRLIRQYKADGTLERLHYKWLHSKCIEENDNQQPESLEIVHFGGVIILSSACIGLVFLIFAMELIVNYFVEKRLRRRNIET